MFGGECAMVSFRAFLLTSLVSIFLLFNTTSGHSTDNKNIAYIVSDIRIPFWDIMSRGIQSKSSEYGYDISILTAENNAKNELQNTLKAIEGKVDGIIVSPTNSSACVTILGLAEKAGIPVVIADIGTEGGKYLSYISSDNFEGAYHLGKVLTEKMMETGLKDATVGIIAIPQKRANGKARTDGFMKALGEAGFRGAGIEQQETFSYQETYDFAKKLIAENPDMKAIWLQGSDKYQGALDAIKDSGNTGEILLITFDAEPEFLDMIPNGKLVGAGMQQPFLMGEKSVQSLHQHFNGENVMQEQKLPVLAISQKNITEKLPTIKRNVLGIIK